MLKRREWWQEREWGRRREWEGVVMGREWEEGMGESEDGRREWEEGQWKGVGMGGGSEGGRREWRK